MTWEFFHPDGTRAPWLVPYTEDRDLWRWALPDSRAVNAALRSYSMTFTEWDRLAGVAPQELAAEGRAILRSDAQTVAGHVKNAVEVTEGGYTFRVVNATTLISEIAGELAKGYPFGACYFIRGDGAQVWSLRSTPDGIDVSEVAKSFGGGGHRNAAGFVRKDQGEATR